MEALFLDFALLGAGWVLWLLVALSVLSVAVMFERWRFLAARRVNVGELISAAQHAIRSGRKAELTRTFGSLASLPVRVALAGVAHKGSREAAAEAMSSAKARGRDDYERNLGILGTLGNNAPFIGLFGTVLGIVGAFAKLKANPEGGIDVVGGDLSQALVATAVGIMVALPAVVAFNAFGRKLRSALNASDEVAHAILAEIAAASSAPTAEEDDGNEDDNSPRKSEEKP